MAIFAVCVAIDKLVTIVNNKEVKLIEAIYNKLFKKKKEDEINIEENKKITQKYLEETNSEEN